MHRSAPALLVLAVAATVALPAEAQSVAPVARRAVPRLDGRAPRRADAVDGLEWIPRIVLAPLVGLLEVARVPSRAVFHSHFLYETFGAAAAGGSFDSSESAARARTHFGIVPTLQLDWGRRPSVGVSMDIAPAGWRQRIALDGVFGGERYYVGSAWDRFAVARGLEIGVRASWWERPDNLDYGAPGPDTRQQDVRWFWMRRAGGAVTASLTFSPIVTLFVASGVQSIRYDLGNAPWQQQGSAYVRAEVFDAWKTDAELRIDTRGPVAVRTGGVRFVARMHHGADLAEPLDRRWIIGEAQAGAYLEVLRPGRVLGLELQASDAEPLGTATVVPFSELPTLGGDAPLRGFLEGRFRGPSVVAASLVYRWPIWVWLEAETRLGVGNAFGPHFDGFSPGALAGSWSLAVKTLPGGPVQAEVLFGLGSSRFDSSHFEVDSARILVGVTRSY